MSSTGAQQRRWMEARALLALGDVETEHAAFLHAADIDADSDRAYHPGCGRALLQSALRSPAGSAELVLLGNEARTVLTRELLPSTALLALLDTY